MDMAKFRELFQVEAREHLHALNRLVVALEAAPADRKIIHCAFRETHSIKGMAATMGFFPTADLAHALEDLLAPFRDGGAVPAAAVDRLLAGADLLEGLLDDIAAGRPERSVATFLAGEELPPVEIVLPPVPAAPTAAPVCHLLIQLAPEAEAPAARLLLLARELRRLGELEKTLPAEAELEQGQGEFRLEAWLRTELSPLRLEELLSAFIDVAHVRVNLEEKVSAETESARSVRVRTDLLDRFVRLTGELITNRTMLQTAGKARDWALLQDGLGRLARLVTELHYHVLQVRMMPLRGITDRLPRLVRDLARKQGKQVQLVLEGEDLELDRAILEELTDPLVHLVRNAIDHGIASQGTVSVRAWREKDQVLLEVADDGCGIDPETVRQRALDRGLLTLAQARALRDHDLLQLICHPGFSTTLSITDTSGRGVGMDVVKTAVDRLGGLLHIASAPGEGTRFRLKLPLSVAIIRVLLVECDGLRLAVPITRVLRTLEVPRAQLQSSGRQLLMALDGELVPLLSLRKVLRLSPQPVAGPVPVVLSEIRGRRVGFVVDRFAGQQEVFVQPPPYPLDRLEGIAGSTITGDGRVLFLLDFQTLLGGMGAPLPGGGA